jgi:hypothetical protein
MEASVVADLIAFDAELLAVIFQHLPATCDHAIDESCREL